MRTSMLFLVSIVLGATACSDSQGYSVSVASIAEPILIDRALLSGVGLERVNFTPNPEREFHQVGVYDGIDLGISMVSSQTWDGSFESFPFDEFVCMFNGRARLIPTDDDELLFESGDQFFAHRGYTGEWNIEAGSNLHYELSVISQRRSDPSATVEPRLPEILDPSILSGTDILLEEKEGYSDTLISGVELEVILNAERPRNGSFDSAKEQLIHVLSGQIDIIDSAEAVHRFFIGDYFIIPRDFSGYWESHGHGIVKYLSIRATN